MSFALCYWILMLVWCVGGVYRHRANLRAGGPDLLLFVLLLLLGWRVFGPPLHP